MFSQVDILLAEKWMHDCVIGTPSVYRPRHPQMGPLFSRATIDALKAAQHAIKYRVLSIGLPGAHTRLRLPGWSPIGQPQMQ